MLRPEDAYRSLPSVHSHNQKVKTDSRMTSSARFVGGCRHHRRARLAKNEGFHVDSSLTQYLEYLGAVLRHSMLGTSFHLRYRLTDRLSVPELPAAAKKAFSQGACSSGYPPSAKARTNWTPDVFPFPVERPAVLFIHALRCLQPHSLVSILYQPGVEVPRTQTVSQARIIFADDQTITESRATRSRSTSSAGAFLFSCPVGVHLNLTSGRHLRAVRIGSDSPLSDISLRTLRWQPDTSASSTDGSAAHGLFRRPGSSDRKRARCCPVLGAEGLERWIVGVVAVALQVEGET
jgi:hypothetical protein